MRLQNYPGSAFVFFEDCEMFYLSRGTTPSRTPTRIIQRKFHNTMYFILSFHGECISHAE